MTARRAKRTSTSKGPGTALRTTGTAFRTTPGGRASATPKTQCRRPTPQRAVATSPHGQAIGLRQRLKWLTKTPRPARAGDSPSTGPASPSAATPPHGQRRSADKNFSRTRFGGSRIRRGDHRQPVRSHPDGLPCAEGLALPFQNRGFPKPLPTEAGGFRATGNVRGSRDTRAEDRPRTSNFREFFPSFTYFIVKIA